jgi:hypothetical protein
VYIAAHRNKDLFKVELSEVSSINGDMYEWTKYRKSQIDSVFFISRAMDGKKKPQGILFHENCWEYLIQHFGYGEICLDTLFSVMRYLPIGVGGKCFRFLSPNLYKFYGRVASGLS